MTSRIHPSAIIEDGAVIGDDCFIGPYCHVTKDVSLGAGNVLHAHVSLVGNTTIGPNNEFFQYACIGSRTEDMKFKAGSIARVEIGGGNIFREYCTVNAATEHGATTKIYDGNVFLSDSHVGHDCIIGSNIVLGCGSKLAGHVEICDYATVNGMTGVIQFVRLGRYSFIGATNKVTKDILPFMIAEGNPSEIRVVNTIGLERRGFAPERIRHIKNVIRQLLKTPSALQEALGSLVKEFPGDPDVTELSAFVTRSRTGIAKMG
ncbi:MULTISPECIES: acyl-ACP--UDP-N-acetylglucosamine O-acyltransferase [unclassified Variovorax]|uniref:acyl-ACP--UDP-N-acetylglucosamine O-acyltransferase n=1 Tax=unclassified Variovorax TaxID=663243 RepID=UPI0008B23D4D|nr:MULTISPECIES: acyl-ACP--UDP-N-acetylglucosamine O-acyltransferase [unclassified Variovorax]SEK17443.1 acyl-[acyl-carrier-protein]--UDP-N-acetylglucosamine O-acyltransferase [Variovorax sp. OK202]SFE84858.1 acyl-[acyl-carrier-protein]--UDP-N-acetylglucosamine O-acyltransferase [Variovorax sp. OK212]